MLTRGDVAWAELDGKRRPYVVVTRAGAPAERVLVTVAPLTTQIRGRPFEAPVPAEVGLPRPSVVNADALLTAAKVRFEAPIGRLDAESMMAIDAAIHYALGLTCPAD